MFSRANAAEDGRAPIALAQWGPGAAGGMDCCGGVAASQ